MMAEHSRELAPLVLTCPLAQADFPSSGVRLVNQGPARLLWDEHGGTYVLRVEDLQPAAAGEPATEAAIRVEVALDAPLELTARVREFAAAHGLSLGFGPPPVAAPVEAPILCACHVPGQSLFIYAEDTQLEVAAAGGLLKLMLTGEFKARRLPSRENDIVIHLTPAAMAHLLSFLLTLLETEA